MVPIRSLALAWAQPWSSGVVIGVHQDRRIGPERLDVRDDGKAVAVSVAEVDVEDDEVSVF